MAVKTKTPKRRKPPKPLERDIQKGAIELLRSLGWRTYRRNTGAMTATHKGRSRLVRFSEPGASDLWAVLPDGTHAEIEIKRPGNRPTPEQLVWLRAMNGIGTSVAFWVSSLADLEEVARHVMAGGTIRYEGDDGRYRLIPPKPEPEP